jgi:hypothetical protein
MDSLEARADAGLRRIIGEYSSERPGREILVIRSVKDGELSNGSFIVSDPVNVAKLRGLMGEIEGGKVCHGG